VCTSWLGMGADRIHAAGVEVRLLAAGVVDAGADGANVVARSRASWSLRTRRFEGPPGRELGVRPGCWRAEPRTFPDPDPWRHTALGLGFIHQGHGAFVEVGGFRETVGRSERGHSTMAIAMPDDIETC